MSVHKLAQIHAATHPGAMLRPLAKTNGLKLGDAGEPAASADEVLTLLAAESEDEGLDVGDREHTGE